MTLGKIFLVVVLAVLVAAIIIKFWREILDLIEVVVIIVLSVVLAIILLPIGIVLNCCGYYSEERLQRKIVEKYDAMFFSTRSKKDLRKKMKAVRKLERTLQEIKEKKENRKIEKMLDECKWTL